MSFLRGFGFMLTTETDRVDLGTFGTRHLRGRTEQRLLRVAVGEAAGFRLVLSRQRPVAVEVTEAAEAGDAGRHYDVAVPVPPDPWIAAAGRLLLVWLLSQAISTIVGRRIRRTEESHGSA